MKSAGGEEERLASPKLEKSIWPLASGHGHEAFGLAGFAA